MKLISLCWSFFPFRAQTIALLVLDPICTLEDVLDPAVFQYYERGIYERFPNHDIRFVAYRRDFVGEPLRRYQQLAPMLAFPSDAATESTAVCDSELIAALDRHLVDSRLFVCNATSEEWNIIAPPGYLRPAVWKLQSDSNLRPWFHFDDGQSTLLLLVLRHAKVEQADVDRVIRANQAETERCFPDCSIRVAECVIGKIEVQSTRYRIARLPRTWTSLEELDWTNVDDPEDLFLLDGMLDGAPRFNNLSSPAERKIVGENFREAYWARKALERGGSKRSALELPHTKEVTPREMRAALREVRDELICEQYRDGDSVSSLAKSHFLSPGRISLILRAYGVPRRSFGRLISRLPLPQGKR